MVGGGCVEGRRGSTGDAGVDTQEKGEGMLRKQASSESDGR